jgi:hypothetical protein
VTVKGLSWAKGLPKGETWAKTSRFERFRPDLTSLGSVIIVQANPEAAISRKVGLIWGNPG